MLRFGVVLVALLLAACTADTTTEIATAVDAAQSASRQGDITGALAVVDARLAALASDNPALTWRLQLLRAELLVARRDLDAATVAINRPLPTGPELAPARAHQQYLQARLAVERGNLDEGLRLAQAVRQDTNADADTRGDIALLLGRLHLMRGNWDQAVEVLTPVLSPSGDRYRQLQALNNLGYGRLRIGRYDEALNWLERGLALSDFERTQAYATAITNAGICYSRLGLFDRAMNVHKRAIEIQRANGGAMALVQALGSLGNTYVLSGDATAALPYLKEAFDVAQAAHLEQDAALWAGNLSAAHAGLGNWDEAERFNELSRTLDRQNAVVKQSTLVLNAATVAKGRGDLQQSRSLFEEVLAVSEGSPSVEWTARVGLAEVALASQQPVVAAGQFERALTTIEKTRADLQKTDYRLSFLNQLIEFYRAYVDTLVSQERSDRALEIVESSRARVLAERQRVDAPAHANVAAFQRIAARSKTTLLAYWLAPKRSFLWVVSGSGVRRIDLPPAAEIEKAVGEYRALIDNSLADPLKASSTPGDRLYQMLIAPARLPREASVVIVPDGALYGINFETLPVDGPQRHYWIADAQVQVAPSLAMLEANTTRPVSDGRLLLIGNPTPRAPEFPALSYAPAEMTSIVRHFPQDRVVAYDSARATPAVYQQATLDQFSMIHFTAHATANVESPLDSAVVLSGPDTAYKLYARDVADKPLKADLVTVSACRSAGERTYSGEGLVGFAWAFLRAGAHRVVAGLWDVDDRSTAQLMDALYSGVQAGQSPAASLRAAKLTLLANGGQLARPYYWGPFQMFTVTP